MNKHENQIYLWDEEYKYDLMCLGHASIPNFNLTWGLKLGWNIPHPRPSR